MREREREPERARERERERVSQTIRDREPWKKSDKHNQHPYYDYSDPYIRPLGMHRI